MTWTMASTTSTSNLSFSAQNWLEVHCTSTTQTAATTTNPYIRLSHRIDTRMTTDLPQEMVTAYIEKNASNDTIQDHATAVSAIQRPSSCPILTPEHHALPLSIVELDTGFPPPPSIEGVAPDQLDAVKEFILLQGNRALELSATERVADEETAGSKVVASSHGFPATASTKDTQDVSEKACGTDRREDGVNLSTEVANTVRKDGTSSDHSNFFDIGDFEPFKASVERNEKKVEGKGSPISGEKTAAPEASAPGEAKEDFHQTSLQVERTPLNTETKKEVRCGSAATKDASEQGELDLETVQLRQMVEHISFLDSVRGVALYAEAEEYSPADPFFDKVNENEGNYMQRDVHRVALYAETEEYSPADPYFERVNGNDGKDVQKDDLENVKAIIETGIEGSSTANGTRKRNRFAFEGDQQNDSDEEEDEDFVVQMCTGENMAPFKRLRTEGREDLESSPSTLGNEVACF
ncbi:hypothetical protein DFP72DRAFT_1171508 [Ephemerocybe angulata]|uniref:Uncharacterized protein n=1 Tax=Ephemerocybe angulata TaxID=980116 RepID=A0A8H6HSZ0_9AGAR|nr:hypothetical protein DFP72DRAFT_1171508 [Tulosesus angulatus]